MENIYNNMTDELRSRSLKYSIKKSLIHGVVLFMFTFGGLVGAMIFTDKLFQEDLRLLNEMGKVNIAE